MEIKDLPVLLLTGYLGSGKTTLLNRILTNRKGIRFAVIVNDIGEVNIDADLIQQGGVVGKKDDSLVALQNGCICCTLKMDLVEQLRDICALQRFDYVVIEASGICEPEPIARTICSIPSIGIEYIKDGMPKLDCIATVVDALRMQDEFSCGEGLLGGNIGEEDIENLVIQQIEFCNIVLLNKASMVTAAELGRIRSIIHTLQPEAEILECDYCDIELDKLLNTGLFNYQQISGSATWIKEVEKAHDDHGDDDEYHRDDIHEDDHELDRHHDDHGDDDDNEHHEGHHHHHHHHHDGEGEAEEYGIGTYVYYNRRPFDINKFDNFVAKHWPKGIIRAKGICYFDSDYDKCYLFEQAGKQVSMQDTGLWYATMPKDELAVMMIEDPVLARDWDPVYGDRMEKLVFIGQHLDKEAIKSALDACLA